MVKSLRQNTLCTARDGTKVLQDWIFCIINKTLITSNVRVLVFNAPFNNISVTSWRSVLLLQETRVPGENHRPAASC